MQKYEVLKGISHSGTWLKYVQNAMEAQGMKWLTLSGASRRASEKKRHMIYLLNISTNSPCKLIILKAVSGTVQIKCSIPLIYNQWENSWVVSGKVWMESNVPELFGEKQWTIPTCMVKKVQTVFTAVIIPRIVVIRADWSMWYIKFEVCSEDAFVDMQRNLSV